MMMMALRNSLNDKGGQDDSNGGDNNMIDDEVSSIDLSLHNSTLGAGSGHHRGGGSDEGTNAECTLARRETKAVWGLKGLVAIVLLVSMIIVAVATFMYVRNSEKSQFEQTFREDANKVLASLGASLDKAIAGVDAYVVNALSYARDTNQTWPLVTIPDFEARSAKFLSLTKAVVFMEFLLVTNETREEWEKYTARHGPSWAEDSITYLKRNDRFQDVYAARNITQPQYLDFVHDYSAWGVENPVGLPPDHDEIMLPMWQSAPLIPTSPVYNWDLATVVDNESVLECIHSHMVSLSKAYMIAQPGDTSLDVENEAWADYFSNFLTTGEEPMEPLSDLYYPMIEDLVDWRTIRNDPNYDPAQHKIAGILSQSFYWRDMIKNILPQGSDGYLAVFHSGCNPTFTYEINGPTVKFMGHGDPHHPKFDYLETSSLLQNLDQFGVEGQGSSYSFVPLEQETCPWTVSVYPSLKMEDAYTSNNPITFTIASLVIFAFVIAVFLFYDCWVERRQKVVLQSARRSNAIVTSLFPSNVRDRMYTEEKKKKSKASSSSSPAPLKAYLNTEDADNSNNNANGGAGGAGGSPGVVNGDINNPHASPPIADLFPQATVLFADLSGFTAWSSSREPVQVFTLLETIYGAFDRIGKKRGVFKVETIGDCYVAVAGLPSPRKSHAAVLCKFAADCRDSMNSLTTELELTLGPGTADLKLRCGLNSGAVTAGVLRGEKSRFQLFGDTVNVAARMESTGVPNRIQISQKTADELVASGKAEWVSRREDLVNAKGKGKMQTYWVEPRGNALTSSQTESSNHADITEQDDLEHDEALAATQSAENTCRLIDWNTKMFEDLIKKLVAHRKATGVAPEQHEAVHWRRDETRAGCVREEVVKSISLPAFSKVDAVCPETVQLDPCVVAQLHAYISVVAHSYRANPFHNFEHASHVTMSVVKLLQRITTMSHTLSQQEIYIHSFGVAADPLAQLAIAFAALVHDVDHRGVPNNVMAKEEPSMAARYQNKSIAEQNSVDIAWDMFMDQSFAELRSCLFATQKDLDRFRQLIVNSVMATDIFDPDLKRMRNERWTLAFSESAQSDDEDALHRKATIVLEHVIQASDVCHTMQHWSVYQKWNRRLLGEMYMAYLSGRTDKDPSEGWYEGELWFFDNYVIPLAEKLKECSVFGASGHEFLDFAYENRIEWENKGRGLVGEMIKALANNVDDDDEIDIEGEEDFGETSSTKMTEQSSASTTSSEGEGYFHQAPDDPLAGAVAC